MLQQAQAADQPFEINGDNFQAIDLFCFVQTQWRYAGMDGRRTGLDWHVLQDVMKDNGLKRKQRKDTRWRVREIELSALGEWNRQAREEARKKRG